MAVWGKVPENELFLKETHQVAANGLAHLCNKHLNSYA